MTEHLKPLPKPEPQHIDGEHSPEKILSQCLESHEELQTVVVLAIDADGCNRMARTPALVSDLLLMREHLSQLITEVWNDDD